MYVAILTSKLKSILPGKIESAALKAGLPSSSLESLLLNYSTNMTAVPGITPHIMKSIGVAVEQGYADSFRYGTPPAPEKIGKLTEGFQIRLVRGNRSQCMLHCFGLLYPQLFRTYGGRGVEEAGVEEERTPRRSDH